MRGSHDLCCALTKACLWDISHRAGIWGAEIKYLSFPWEHSGEDKALMRSCNTEPETDLPMKHLKGPRIHTHSDLHSFILLLSFALVLFHSFSLAVYLRKKYSWSQKGINTDVHFRGGGRRWYYARPFFAKANILIRGGAAFLCLPWKQWYDPVIPHRPHSVPTSS